jgi:hypothetical protein
MNQIEERKHLDQHLSSEDNLEIIDSHQTANESLITKQIPTPGTITRAKQKNLLLTPQLPSPSRPITAVASSSSIRGTRRSARISISGNSGETEASLETGVSKGKKRVQIEEGDESRSTKR